MDNEPALAISLLHRLKPFIDKDVEEGHKKLEAAYRNGTRDGLELSLILAEIVALKNFNMKLEQQARKANKHLEGILNDNPITTRNS